MPFSKPRVLVHRFKQLDDKVLRPCLIRNHATHEPKILEMYSKLALKDAMEQMRMQHAVCTQPNHKFPELQSEEVWKPNRKVTFKNLQNNNF